MSGYLQMIRMRVLDNALRELEGNLPLPPEVIVHPDLDHVYLIRRKFSDVLALNAGLDGLAHSVRDQPVDQALIEAMKKRGVYQLPTFARELSTFVFAQPGSMLDDPYLAPSVSPEMLRTLKSTEFQQQVGAEPDTAHGRAWISDPLRPLAPRWRSTFPGGESCEAVISGF